MYENISKHKGMQDVIFMCDTIHIPQIQNTIFALLHKISFSSLLSGFQYRDSFVVLILLLLLCKSKVDSLSLVRSWTIGPC